MADRASRYLRLIHLPAGHDAQAVADGLVCVLGSLPETARRTLTWDQGSEMALHELLAPLLAEGVFFAHPASPWQRGTSENTNGLLRQYLPKGSDLSVHSAGELRAIEARLNDRPRKTLSWRTPAQVLAYVQRRREERTSALDRMTEEASQAGIYGGRPEDYAAALKKARKRRGREGAS
jgi:transposase, IS30 family